jgi:hypothetical protein
MTQIELQPNPGKELNMKQENLAENALEGAITSPKPKYDNEVKNPQDLPNVKSELAMEDVASRMDEMAAEVKQLRDDIANIYAKMEGKSEDMEQDMEAQVSNEDAKVKDILKGGVGVGGQGKPNDGGPSKYNMSAQKKFTGAPAAEAKPLEGLFKSNKVENAMSRVFSKMANSKI